MRPSSSPSDPFGALFARGAAATQVSDEAWMQALLDAEAGLARAQAAIGMIPAGHADAITAACDLSTVDAAAIAARLAAAWRDADVPAIAQR